MPSRLDKVYRSILMTRFFTKGWGKPENLKRLFAFRKIVSDRATCFPLVSRDHPISIVKEETHSDCKILQGQFTSPFVNHLPGLLPKEAETAYFQVILPKKWNSEHYKPICLHLAGTGDHGFWRRRQTMAKPLLKSAGIAAVLLENPFYGLRKPKDQVRSSLHNVTDIFVMGGCLILESLALFHWCERHGLGPLGISGLSMGGHMASLAATSWPKPIVLVPCLSGSTASPVFTEGVMSYSINWELLETQFFSDEIYCDEIKKMIELDEVHGFQDAFRAGQHFAQHYPESMDHVNELDKQQKEDLRQEQEEQKKQEEQMQKQIEQQQLLNQQEQHENHQLTEQLENKADEVSESQARQSECFNFSSGQATVSKEVNFISSGLSPQTAAPCAQSTTDSQFVVKEDRPAIGPEGINNNENNETPQNVEKSSRSKKSKFVEKFLTKFSLLKHFNKSKSKLVGATDKTEKVKKKATKEERRSLKNRCDREAFHFMRGIMDECTDLKNFDKPVDTELIIAVSATEDAYVPLGAYTPLDELWPGAELRTVKAGHVTAYVLHQRTFRNTIVECFNRMKAKYWSHVKT